MHKRRCPVMKCFKVTGSVTAIPCGSWSCPICSKANARKWAWRAMLQLDEDSRQCRFWTLTMPGGMKSPAYAFAKLPSLWDALRKTIQRATGAWTYLAFVEGQVKRNGMPHFHVLSYAQSPYRLKDLAAHLGFGYQAYDVVVQSKQAAVYVAKYASKGDKAMPRGFRRVRASRDWHALPYVPHEPFIVPAKGEDLIHYFDRVAEETGLSIDVVKDNWIAFDMKQFTF